VLSQATFSDSLSANTSDFRPRIGGIEFTLNVGTYVPIYNLRKTLKVSPAIGFGFSVIISKKFELQIGTNVFFPVNSNELGYILTDTILVGKPSLSGVMGVWLTRVESIGKLYFWDNRIGTGLGFLQTDIKTNKPEEENDRVYSSETVFINVGTGFRRLVRDYKSIGIDIRYFYVPYNAFQKNLSSDFGNQYLTTSISYNF